MKSYFFLKSGETVGTVFNKVTMESEYKFAILTLISHIGAMEFALETDRFPSSKNYTN